jgi:hypothetical protein
MILKMGDVRIHHFSHAINSICKDAWHYDMTLWHYNWQNKFPKECQEVVKTCDGNKHRADVLIEDKKIEYTLPFNKTVINEQLNKHITKKIEDEQEQQQMFAMARDYMQMMKDIEDILKGKNRALAGKTMPPKALVMKKVEY